LYSSIDKTGDVYPRDMMIIDGDPERVGWIDFDKAQTFSAIRFMKDRKSGWHLRTSLFRRWEASWYVNTPL
jgi:hypothetical protein